MNELVQLLRQLEQARFYGSVELKYEAGRVVLIRKSETLKLSELSCRDTRSTGNEAKR
ncbi:MAG TPA: hypothetical protein VJW94_03510 [Candidatus Acidoferrum sp.]|nr:hypothetical protein [Candidatus Acidoferrum sp.]